MTITDEELQNAHDYAQSLPDWQCDRKDCICNDHYPDLTKEDLVRDLIEARERIKVLESNQCAC